MCCLRAQPNCQNSHSRTRVRGFDVGLLYPGRSRAGEDIHRAAVGGGVIGLVAVDASCVAVLIVSANGEGVSRERHRKAKYVTIACVGGFDVGLLGPGRSRAGEDVHRAAAKSGVIGLIAVDASCVAVFIISADGEGVSRERDRIAKMVLCASVGGFDVGLLGPSRS